jgi:hypothetical protein
MPESHRLLNAAYSQCLQWVKLGSGDVSSMSGLAPQADLRFGSPLVSDVPERVIESKSEDLNPAQIGASISLPNWEWIMVKISAFHFAKMATHSGYCAN